MIWDFLFQVDLRIVQALVSHLQEPPLDTMHRIVSSKILVLHFLPFCQLEHKTSRSLTLSLLE